MSLTSHLKDVESPVRRFFEERLGNASGLQRSFRERAGYLVVPGSAANAGTIGGATDWLLRFLVTPTPDVHLAFAGAERISNNVVAATIDMATRLGTTVDPLNSAWAEVPGRPGIMAAIGTVLGDGSFVPTAEMGHTPTFPGPASASTVAPDLLARGCWALALLTEAFRAGREALDHGPLARFAPGAGCSTIATADELLGLAPPEALEELAGLREVLQGSLLPALSERCGSWALGPTFAGSGLVRGADADLLAAGLLVELKTTLGRKRDEGGRTCFVDKLELFQVAGYALLDFDDWYHVDELGIFSAR